MAEILGTAASIIQVAEAGFSLATTLYSYAKSVKGAEKDINKIARDVKLTAKVLQRTHDQLQIDRDAQTCTEEAIHDLEDVLDGCKEAFQEVDESLTKSMRTRADGKTTISRTEKLKWPLRSSKLEVLRANLEKLKTSLLLMLSVVAYGSKLSQNRVGDMAVTIELTLEKLQIQNLVQAKEEATIRYEELSKAFSRLESRVDGNTKNDPDSNGLDESSKEPADSSSPARAVEANITLVAMSDCTLPPVDPRSDVATAPQVPAEVPSEDVTSTRLELCASAVNKLTASIDAAMRKWRIYQDLEYEPIASSWKETCKVINALESHALSLTTHATSTQGASPVLLQSEKEEDRSDATSNDVKKSKKSNGMRMGREQLGTSCKPSGNIFNDEFVPSPSIVLPGPVPLQSKAGRVVYGSDAALGGALQSSSSSVLVRHDPPPWAIPRSSLPQPRDCTEPYLAQTDDESKFDDMLAKRANETTRLGGSDELYAQPEDSAAVAHGHNSGTVSSTRPRIDKLSVHDRQDYLEAFSIFDKDNDGRIQATILRELMRSLGLQFTNEELKDMLSEVGLDANGTIGREEFLALMLHAVLTKDNRGAIPSQDNVDDLLEAIRVLDKDRGTISPPEMRDMLKSLSCEMRNDEIDDILHAAGVKGDGSVNFAKLMDIMLADIVIPELSPTPCGASYDRSKLCGVHRIDETDEAEELDGGPIDSDADDDDVVRDLLQRWTKIVE